VLIPYKWLVIIALLLSSQINADDLEIDSLLKDIEKKSDLSEKTKLENSGISFIYTRDDLRRMQAKYLKDILKSSYSYGYNENRYGLPDPLTQGTNAPYMSGIVRVYIDNQEITSGMFGSGVVFFGDIDIGFVDHIEIYTQSPTYEFSTEATYMLVKLYSKKASKDEGGKIEINGGSYGSARVSGYYSQELNNDWSYFTYLSHNNDNRKNNNSHHTKLSRDKDVTHIFTSLHNENNNILIDATKQKRDTFIGISPDATPVDGRRDMRSFHIGYDATYNNFSFLTTYDYSDIKGYLIDDVTAPFVSFREKDSYSKSYTAEIKYDFIRESNKLTTGLKYRYKDYDLTKQIVNNIKFPDRKNKAQSVSTIFAENQFSINESSIVSTGILYSEVNSNHSIQDDNLVMYKIGYTHLYDNWIFKFLGSHSETALEPYLIENPLVVDGKLAPQKSDNVYGNFIYTDDKNRYELLVGFMKVKNYLMADVTQNNKIDNIKNDLEMKSTLFRWTYEYNNYDKLFTDFSYQAIDNLPNIDNFKSYSAVIRSLNSYKDFDFFNEMIFYRDNVANKTFCDYSAGVIYQYTQDMTFSIKGKNLFDKAKTTQYYRVNPTTMQSESPLEISPIDRKITLSLEYLF